MTEFIRNALAVAIVYYGGGFLNAMRKDVVKWWRERKNP